MFLEKGEYPVPVKYNNTMPNDLRPVTLRNDEQAWVSAEAWLLDSRNYIPGGNRPGHGLVLFGPLGTGKTMIASAWLNFIERVGKYRVGFISDGKLARYIRLRTRHDDVDDEMDKLENSGYLVVDDLMRLGTQRMPNEVEAFLRDREIGGHPTIVTLNNSVALPASLQSLLSTWTWASFEGVDLRQPGALSA